MVQEENPRKQDEEKNEEGQEKMDQDENSEDKEEDKSEDKQSTSSSEVSSLQTSPLEACKSLLGARPRSKLIKRKSTGFIEIEPAQSPVDVDLPPTKLTKLSEVEHTTRRASEPYIPAKNIGFLPGDKAGTLHVPPTTEGQKKSDKTKLWDYRVQKQVPSLSGSSEDLTPSDQLSRRNSAEQSKGTVPTFQFNVPDGTPVKSVSFSSVFPRRGSEGSMSSKSDLPISCGTDSRDDDTSSQRSLVRQFEEGRINTSSSENISTGGPSDGVSAPPVSPIDTDDEDAVSELPMEEDSSPITPLQEETGFSFLKQVMKGGKQLPTMPAGMSQSTQSREEAAPGTSTFMPEAPAMDVEESSSQAELRPEVDEEDLPAEPPVEEKDKGSAGDFPPREETM